MIKLLIDKGFLNEDEGRTISASGTLIEQREGTAVGICMMQFISFSRCLQY